MWEYRERDSGQRPYKVYHEHSTRSSHLIKIFEWKKLRKMNFNENICKWRAYNLWNQWEYHQEQVHHNVAEEANLEQRQRRLVGARMEDAGSKNRINNKK